MGEVEDEPKAFRAWLRKTRVIWRRLDCLNLSFLRCKKTSLAHNAQTARPPVYRPCIRNRELPTGGQWETIPLKEANEAPTSRCYVSYLGTSDRLRGASPMATEPP